MKRTLLYIIYYIAWLAAFGQTGSRSDAIIKEVSARQQAVKTLQASFTQTRSTKMLREPQVSEGKIYCQQPDLLRWEYTSPRAKVFTTTQKKGMEGSAARLIMSLVTGGNLSNKTTFSVQAEATKDAYILTLTPLRKDIKRLYSRIILHYDTLKRTVTEVTLHGKEGESTAITFRDIHIDEPIHADIFAVK